MLNRLRDAAAPVLDTTDYPTRWSEYVGQGPAKEMLQVAAKSARMRREPLDHVLIAHQSPGIGKTALGVLLSIEMRTVVRVASGQMDAEKARIVFAGMKDGDILFYDEFHQVMDAGRRHAEWMLHYLQDGVIMGPLGPEEQPRVTVVAATTDPQKLPPAIVDRFTYQPPMQEYTAPEAAKIASVLAKKVLVPEGLPVPSKRECLELAIAANHNPRAIRRLLKSVRDLVVTKAVPIVDGRYAIDEVLRRQGITPDGLDRTAQRYLLTLASEFGGKAGAKSLQDRMMHPGGLATIERILMDKGYLAKTNTGRSLTQDGIKRFRELAENEEVA